MPTVVTASCTGSEDLPAAGISVVSDSSRLPIRMGLRLSHDPAASTVYYSTIPVRPEQGVKVKQRCPIHHQPAFRPRQKHSLPDAVRAAAIDPGRFEPGDRRCAKRSFHCHRGFSPVGKPIQMGYRCAGSQLWGRDELRIGTTVALSCTTCHPGHHLPTGSESGLAELTVPMGLT